MSISDAIILIDRYSEHINIFIDKYLNIMERTKLKKQLELANVISNAHFSGTKEGNNIFNTWKNLKLRDFNELLRKYNEPEKTVFEKLKGTKKLPNTVFTRLKMMKEGVYAI